jgi:hypothetical protein
MDLYTLTKAFLPKDQVDEFVSAIWTERYSVAGDTELVVQATPENLAKFAPGTFLALRGTKEVMELKTVSIEKNLAKIKGFALPRYLNERVAWFRNPNAGVSASDRIADYSQIAKLGEFLADVVNKSVINPVAFTGEFLAANLNWTQETIPGLSLGAVDASGAAERLTLSAGPLYDSLARLAEPGGVGQTVYLDSATELGYSLKYTTYRGKDRTSTQDVNKKILLSPNLETVNGLKEVRSNELYKNVCYVYYQGIVSTHYADPALPVPEGFDRRTMVVNPDKEPVGRPIVRREWDNLSGGQRFYDVGSVMYVGPAEIAAFRAQVAKDAFANNNYIMAIDGQTNPNNEYVYGVDYGLGDLIELQGLTGAISKARVTEHIRSQDQYGEKSYPTISVVT